VVKALLYISKIENAQFLKDESASPNLIINEVLEELEDWINSKGITVSCEWKDDFEFSPCNKSLLHTLLFNLVSNAVKYNVENGRVTIVGKKEEKNFSLSILDSGVGIASEQISFIFDRFKRFRPSDDMSYGLGLPIVKTIAEFHNITITAESEINKGTTFTILFPINQL
jgi:signal transduction histidine kinase